jgi:dipeptidyl aminopeptidase/acylaminoacyl peptidase
VGAAYYSLAMPSKSQISSKPGEWPSPLNAKSIAHSSVSLGFTQVVNGELWWSEIRPNESGRTAIVSESGLLLPAPWSASSGVHEYGGYAWLGHVKDGKTFLTFSNEKDQRVYSSEIGSEPKPITPETDRSHRYIEFLAVGDEIWSIREKHAPDHSVSRDLIAISRSGIRSLDSGSQFYANPRISPDGRHLCWISWNHPQMPFDGTQLRVADIKNHQLENVRTLAGSKTLSVLGPEWADDQMIYFISEETGWWNPWQITLAGTSEQIISEETEWAGPMWKLGYRYIQMLKNGKFVSIHGKVDDRKLALVDPVSKTFLDIQCDFNSIESTYSVTENRVYIVGGGQDMLSTILEIDLGEMAVKRYLYETKSPGDPSYFTKPYEITVPGENGRFVHAIFHPAYNPEVNYSGSTPLLVTAHGGPTDNSTANLNISYNFFTSRGIAVVDVNYGGSSGYGREYRQALNGNWGIIDCEDVISVVTALVKDGVVNKDQILIRGGSAGGFTVLNVLVNSDIFAAGACYYGVSELTSLASDTHDFESRYLDSLIGPYPECKALYIQRSPLTHADNLSSPLIIFQGLDDNVVPPSQSHAFRDVCMRKGIKHELIEFEGEGHGFRKAQNIVRCLESEILFYGEVLGFTPQLN